MSAATTAAAAPANGQYGLHVLIVGAGNYVPPPACPRLSRRPLSAL